MLRGVCGAIVEMLTDLVTWPAQRESKEQGCNTKLERRGGIQMFMDTQRMFFFLPCVPKARQKPNDHEWRKKYLKEPVHHKEEWTLSHY